MSVALTSDDGVNPVALALADLKAGRVDDGVSLLEFLHASAPEDPEVLFLLGSCLSDRGDLRAPRHTFAAPSNYSREVRTGW